MLNELKQKNLIIDLFSGPGGLSLGAARAGFSILCAAENDPHAAATHRRNFPETLHIEEDVSALTGHRLKAVLRIRDGHIAGVVGGPPCQGFSCIGKNDRSDPRNRLFVDFFRLVAEIRPKFYIAENVPGVLNAGNARLREEAFSYVEEEYEIVPPMVICAKDFGAPTTRTRVFFFGYRRNEMERLAADDFKHARLKKVTVGDALRGLPVKISPKWQTEEQGWRIIRKSEGGSFFRRLYGHIPPGVGDAYALERLRKEQRVSGCLGTVHSREVARRYAEIEPGTRDPISKSHKLSLDDFCPTLRAGTGSDYGRFQAVRPLHPTEVRVITPREAARLQGFPDWFRFSPTKWHSFREIGSSVSPILAERILAIIRKAIT